MVIIENSNAKRAGSWPLFVSFIFLLTMYSQVYMLYTSGKGHAIEMSVLAAYQTSFSPSASLFLLRSSKTDQLQWVLFSYVNVLTLRGCRMAPLQLLAVGDGPDERGTARLIHNSKLRVSLILLYSCVISGTSAGRTKLPLHPTHVLGVSALFDKSSAQLWLAGVAFVQAASWKDSTPDPHVKVNCRSGSARLGPGMKYRVSKCVESVGEPWQDFRGCCVSYRSGCSCHSFL